MVLLGVSVTLPVDQRFIGCATSFIINVPISCLSILSQVEIIGTTGEIASPSSSQYDMSNSRGLLIVNNGVWSSSSPKLRSTVAFTSSIGLAPELDFILSETPLSKKALGPRPPPADANSLIDGIGSTVKIS